MYFLLVLVGAIVLNLVITPVIIKLAKRYDVVDRPTLARKIHLKPVPLAGGLGVFLSISLSLAIYYIVAPIGAPHLIDSHVTSKQLLGLFFGALVLIIGGLADDKFDLPPYKQIIGPLLAVVILLLSGLQVDKLTNPFGGYIELSHLWSSVLIFVWVLLVIYTTKFLDGLDGLVGGMTTINALVIAALSLFFFVNHATALVAMATAGAFIGFLFFNFNPAKIFLGEGGSTLAGFIIATLAVLSGAKVATTMLIMGLPIMDALWVVAQRVIVDKKSPFVGDKKHLHYRLLASGMSPRQAVLLLWSLSMLFGASALFLQSSQKVIGLGVLLAVMVLASLLTIHFNRDKMEI